MFLKKSFMIDKLRRRGELCLGIVLRVCSSGMSKLQKETSQFTSSWLRTIIKVLSTQELAYPYRGSGGRTHGGPLVSHMSLQIHYSFLNHVAISSNQLRCSHFHLNKKQKQIVCIAMLMKMQLAVLLS